MQTYVPDSFFIDVCAGTGAIGIEALSRGADKAVFIENNRKAIAVIEENLERTHLADRAQVLTADAITGLMQTENKGPAGVIFIDPPYGRNLEEQIMKLLSSSKLVDDDTLIVIEASNDTELDYLGALGFNIIKTKEYRTNKHVFIMKG
jgi:16S rRNA (guanine966-N2)-methyltransferase